MYGQDNLSEAEKLKIYSTDEAHEHANLHIQGHPLGQWHRTETVIGPAPITPATSGLASNSTVGMLRHSSLEYVDNTSNAGADEWVQRNQTAMECSENWTKYYGSTERKSDSRRSYDFKVLSQECENIINPGLVASNNHYVQQRKERGPGAAFSGRVDLSVELDRLKINSHEFPQGNPFQRHSTAGVLGPGPGPVLQANDSVWTLKNSLLHNVENTSKAEGYDWAQSNPAAVDGPENWVNSDLVCNGRTVSSNPYNFNALTQECENLNSGNGSSDNVNVNELASYLDDIVHIPKNMTEWADRMYT